MRDFNSVDDFMEQVRKIDPLFPDQFQKAVIKALDAMTTVFWQDTFKRLLDTRHWQELAGNPEAFERELECIFAHIKQFMKRNYGIRDHRPVKQAKRDAEIWMMKSEHPHWTDGEIGARFGLKNNAVNSALKRYEIRERRRLESLRDVVVFLAEIQSRLKTTEADPAQTNLGMGASSGT